MLAAVGAPPPLRALRPADRRSAGRPRPHPPRLAGALGGLTFCSYSRRSFGRLRARPRHSLELDGHAVSPKKDAPHRCTLIYLHGLGGCGGSYLSAESEDPWPWRLGDSYAPGLRVALPSAPLMDQPWGERLGSWYVYGAATSNQVASPEALAQVRDALDEVVRREVQRMGQAGRVFLGGISQGCNTALDAYLRLAPRFALGGFVGSVGFVPSDARGFPGADRRLRSLLRHEQAARPVWLQYASEDMDVPRQL
ncbi:unnamed protein product, partial [Effrenium voratum]